MSKKTALMDEMEAAAIELLKSVNGTTMTAGDSGDQPQPIDLKGRVAAFEAVTAFLAVKHKIEPAGAKSSGIDRYRRDINGSAAERRAGIKAVTDTGSPTDPED
jgi:hypothetical protein